MPIAAVAPRTPEAPTSLHAGTSEVAALARRLARERSARLEAEAIAEETTGKLYALVEELERSNKDLQQFAYVASHDLQEPLRMVSSFVRLLGDRYKGRLDADADEFIRFAVDGATRMQRLVEDLLQVSRVATRAHPFAPTDMEALLAEVERSLAAQLTECGATVTHDPLPPLRADRDQMAQVLQNLMANAAKFHGLRRPAIHVGATRVGDAWRFHLRDNGIGIDLAQAGRLFQIFQRLHRDEYPGTGIGLAICKRIVERHGGRIWIESEPGQGTTFLFTVPDARGGA
jgi:light-regulated signal transduction histidine kinase (bacteriophytochrome)